MEGVPLSPIPIGVAKFRSTIAAGGMRVRAAASLVSPHIATLLWQKHEYFLYSERVGAWLKVHPLMYETLEAGPSYVPHDPTKDGWVITETVDGQLLDVLSQPTLYGIPRGSVPLQCSLARTARSSGHRVRAAPNLQAEHVGTLQGGISENFVGASLVDGWVKIAPHSYPKLIKGKYFTPHNPLTVGYSIIATGGEELIRVAGQSPTVEVPARVVGAFRYTRTPEVRVRVRRHPEMSAEHVATLEGGSLQTIDVSAIQGAWVKLAPSMYPKLTATSNFREFDRETEGWVVSHVDGRDLLTRIFAPTVPTAPSISAAPAPVTTARAATVPTPVSTPAGAGVSTPSSQTSTINEEEKKRLAELEIATTCQICLELKKEIVFQCGHSTCSGCASHVSQCPFCRVTIVARIKMF
jgi:hypothetical protein